MNAPICEFVEKYIGKSPARLHMPGHKGIASRLGAEPFDITEVKGADYLYEASGIIGESEKNCSQLFGSGATFYSCEGSSLSVKTMVTLAALARKDKSRRGEIIAARNCHVSFISGCILADVVPVWVYGGDSLCSCDIDVSQVEAAVEASPSPCGVYVTSPDYLGNAAPVGELSEICKKHGIPLLVDNAHGAYLKFMERDTHPLTLGADICCDSAHKTLPVLTGGGYLHISKNADGSFRQNAKKIMSLYGSTSPSFLILQSLDRCNLTLSEGYGKKLEETARKVSRLGDIINRKGFEAHTFEPLKLTVFPKGGGLTGEQAAELLRKKGAEPEYADSDSLVMMFSPMNPDEDYRRVEAAFSGAGKLPPIPASRRVMPKLEMAMTPREAAFSRTELIPVELSAGRICAASAASCQPSVPLAVCGERLTSPAAEILKLSGFDFIEAVAGNEK